MPPVTNSYSSSYSSSSPTPIPPAISTPPGSAGAAKTPATITYPSMPTIQTNILTVAKGLNVPKPRSKCKKSSYPISSPPVPDLSQLPLVPTQTQTSYPIASSPAVYPVAASPVVTNSYMSIPSSSPSINPVSY